MRKNLKNLILAGALVTTTAYADEIRTPWISSRGPLRYTFDRLNECGWNINWWSAAHTKEANKAFLKHGTKSHELSALIFNQADFTLDLIFPGSIVPPDAPNFNPFLATTQISPRVSYSEYGLTTGMEASVPVWCDKGRLGVRVSVPFRRIEMERDDTALAEDENPLDGLVAAKVVRIDRNSEGVFQENNFVDVVTRAYKMSLIKQLTDGAGDPILTAPGSGGLAIFGQPIGSSTDAGDPEQKAPTALTSSAANNPSAPSVYAFQFNDGVADSAVSDAYSFEAGQFVTLATDYSNLPPAAGTISRIETDTVYNNPTNAASLNNTWLIFRRQTDSPDPERFGAGEEAQAGVGAGVARGIDELLKQFNQNLFTFLTTAGFGLDDSIRSGLGDIDVDVFYQHDFCDELRGELALGVRFPTGGDKDQYGNPFRVVGLGNGGHFEIKLFGLIAWQALCWMNIKVDASYNFVLESTERRMAVFQGSQIKNFGPRADADVNWGYFIGHFDLNFTHPCTSKIRSMLGYEFYYATKTHISFKQATAQTFLGTTGNLDNNLASKNSERIGHKVRSETSVDVNKYFELFAGATATFAGQYVMKDRDLHAGFNVRF